VGETTFVGLPLFTAGSVMTPRPATEQLVAAALDRIGGGPARVVDVGTGSGAIAIAIAHAVPASVVWATDNSRSAVTLAEANVRRHELQDQVTVVHGDLIEPVPGPIDLVVANLPYLPIADAANYPELAGEPSAALFGAADGLGAYRRLLEACKARLASDAGVVIQLHRSVFAASVSELHRLRALLDGFTPRLAAAA
jgi:release factor glutamine methyltransferase